MSAGLALDLDSAAPAIDLKLRPLQEPIFGLIREAWLSGATNVLVQAPCGFGKTEVATAILQATRDKYKRGAFICDRIALVEQTSERFDKYGLQHSIQQASHWRFDRKQRIQLCSIQTLTSRNVWPETDLLIVDEAHILPKALRDRLLERKVRSIGLTATPLTRGLGLYFDTVVNAATTRQLIREGWLCNYRIFSASEPDMSGVRVEKTGEWNDQEAEAKLLPIVGDCVAEYLKLGENKKFIAFAKTVGHAEELQRQFLDAGIHTALYTYQQTDTEKKASVEEFRKPDSFYRGMISIESLTRGFDVADVEVLILARPLRKALHVHIQMIGRVLRNAPGKKEAIILDHAGNCARFWAATEDFFDNGVSELDDGKKRESKPKEAKEKEPIKCPKCSHVHNPRPSCPNCGHNYPRRSNILHIAGELRELTGIPVTSSNVAQELYSQLLAIALTKGKEPKWAMAMYKARTNEWPNNLAMVTAPPTPQLESWVRSQQIRHAKAMEKSRGGNR